MNLKTFTARSMAEALALVRQAYGSRAVILHTRTYKRGGVLGIGARTVVEVTAGDGREVGRARASAGARVSRSGGASRPASRTAVQPGRPANDSRAPVPTSNVSPLDQADRRAAGDLIRRTYEAARAEFERTSGGGASRDGDVVALSANAGTATATSPAAPAGATLPDHEQLTREMQGVRRLVERLMHQQRQSGTTPSQLPDGLFDQYRALIEQEVTEELADQVIAEVRQRLSEDELSDPACCRREVLAALAGHLPIDPEAGAVPTPPTGGPRKIALVGPTGVGKTTTVAKLAATFKLKQSQKVALITLDTYRIAAVDQLRTYAGIIGVPLHVVSRPEQMDAALAACGGCDVVLIDTAGRSQRDGDRLEELARYLEAASPHEVHLVLSSTCSQSVLMETIERFSKIRTDRVIFTKLDEAVTFGVVLNVLRKLNKRLSYVTTGQEVPHQIEPGRGEKLAALLLGEEAVGR